MAVGEGGGSTGARGEGEAHTIVAGDSIVSIASRFGYFPEQLWNHPANAELKARRADPNTLLPGDVVRLPGRVGKQAPVATGERHRFRRRGIPARFRIQLFEGDRPRAGQAWRLELSSGQVTRGVTDERGVVESWLAPDATRGLLTVGPRDDVLVVLLGDLNPADATTGLQHRLKNLGYLASERCVTTRSTCRTGSTSASS